MFAILRDQNQFHKIIILRKIVSSEASKEVFSSSIAFQVENISIKGQTKVIFFQLGINHGSNQHLSK